MFWSCYNCSLNDRAAVNIKVYTQTELKQSQISTLKQRQISMLKQRQISTFIRFNKIECLFNVEVRRYFNLYLHAGYGGHMTLTLCITIFENKRLSFEFQRLIY